MITIRKILFRGLIELLEIERKLLLEALPYQFVISNIILCVIKMIGEEDGQTNAVFGNLMPHDSLNVWLLLNLRSAQYTFAVKMKRKCNFFVSLNLVVSYCRSCGKLRAIKAP